MKTAANTTAQIASLKEFAQANYAKGYDVFVETWEERDWEELMVDAMGNTKKARKMMADIVEARIEAEGAQAFEGPAAPEAEAPVDAPVVAEVPAAATPAPSAPEAPTAVVGAGCYSITTKAQAIAPHLTLQRGCTVPVGVHWRANGHKATNTRLLVIEALYEIAGEDGEFTHAQAMAALKPLKDGAFLGSGTPASYLRAFVKSGYLEVA